MSKKKILVFGAGSVGAHHINAARHINAKVSVTDINDVQLRYLKKKLYPSRYKKWDEKIEIIKYEDVFKLKDTFDLIVLGISPLHHLPILKKCLKSLKLKRILVEKPLFTFNQKINSKFFLNHQNKIYCGFNHEVSESILFLKKYIKSKEKINKIDISWKESFKHLLKAHPWIKTIDDTYLSNVLIGGGVLHEFSHAVHITNTLKDLIKTDRPLNFTSKIFFKKNIKNKKYDYSSKIFFKNNELKISTNINGVSIIPKKKIIVTSGKETFIWERLAERNQERVIICGEKANKFQKIFKITRPQDFITQTKLLISNKKKDINKIECNNFVNSMKTHSLIKKCIKNY